MSLPVRVGTLLVAFLAVVGGAIFVVIHFFLAGPPVIDFTSGVGKGQPVNIVLQDTTYGGSGNCPNSGMGSNGNVGSNCAMPAWMWTVLH